MLEVAEALVILEAELELEVLVVLVVEEQGVRVME
jgi:hypothetical protein